MVYINSKPILLLCDNTVYVKIKAEIREHMKEAETGCPYDGANLHYILDIENHDLINEVLPILEGITVVPKSRKKK